MIDVKDIPDVALDCLNKDHREVADIINQLDTLLQHAPSLHEDISSGLQRLIEHLENHFACEEHQMEKYQFPALPIHRGEHQRVLAEIKAESATWSTQHNTQQLLHYFEQTFCPWLLDHIATLDTQTALFIVHQGGE